MTPDLGHPRAPAAERADALAGPPTGERFCPACDQFLLGVTLRRCPECGRAFDPDSPSTTSPYPRLPLGLQLAGVVRHANRLWLIALAIIVVVCAMALADMMVLMLIWVVALAPALVTVALSAMPFVRLTWPARAVGLLAPIAVLATCVTYWPFFLSFQLQRPLFDRAADQIAATGPRGPGLIGIIHYTKAEVRFGTNIGFKVTGMPGSGYYVVRADPSQAVIWHNINSDLALGDNWHLVWED